MQTVRWRFAIYCFLILIALNFLALGRAQSTASLFSSHSFLSPTLFPSPPPPPPSPAPSFSTPPPPPSPAPSPPPPSPAPSFSTPLGGGISWEGGVMTYIPSTPARPKVAIALVASGEEYREISANQIAQHLTYAEKYGFYVMLDVRSLDDCVEETKALVKRERNIEIKVGPYVENASLFYGHGWRASFMKPFLLMRVFLQDIDWVLYVDVEHPLRGKSFLSVILSAVERKAPGYGIRDFHVFRHSPRAPANHVIFQNSNITWDIIARWAAHEDCECWVDQGAFWIELMRAEVRYRGLKNASEPCGEVWSSEGRKRGHQFLQQKDCVTPPIPRWCTVTRPGSMVCGCGDWPCLDLFYTDVAKWNSTAQTPPFFFWGTENNDEQTRSFMGPSRAQNQTLTNLSAYVKRLKPGQVPKD